MGLAAHALHIGYAMVIVSQGRVRLGAAVGVAYGFNPPRDQPGVKSRRGVIQRPTRAHIARPLFRQAAPAGLH